MNTSDALQAIVNLPLKDKLDMTIQLHNKLVPVLARYDKDNHGLGLMIALMSSAVNADGELTPEELALIKGIVDGAKGDVPVVQLIDIIKLHRKMEVYDLIKVVAANMSNAERADLVTFVSLLSSIDDKISKSEVAYILDLLEI